MSSIQRVLQPAIQSAQTVIMEINIICLTCLILSVNGQFLGTEYKLDSVPLNVRHRHSSARYEIQPSVSQEVEYHSPETARISNQGRRHIEDHHRSNEQPNNRNVNEFEPKLFTNHNVHGERVEDNYRADNRGQIIHNDDQYSRTPHSQDHASGSSHNSYNERNTNQNIRNDGESYPYDSNLKTNLDNTRQSPNIRTSSNRDSMSVQRSYPSNDNVRINQNPTNQQSERGYENNRRSEPPNTPNYAPNNQDYFSTSHNVRVGEYPINQDGSKVYVNDRINHTEYELSRETTKRAENNNKERKNSEPTINGDNVSKLHSQDIDARHEYNNRNYESNRQTTEPSRKITTADRIVTSGTKSTQDNELASRTYLEGRSENKDENQWLWPDQKETVITTTVSTVQPAVDDRAAFNGDKCPTGKVRFNNICVDKH